MKAKFTLTIVSLVVLVSISTSLSSDEKVEEKNVVTINPDSQKMAGIVTISLVPKPLTLLIPAPGEVIPNATITTKITSRIAAQVIRPQVQEGQHVKEGEPLVTLSSVEMARTQGDLLLAAQEWERVKNLGKDAVSSKRYSEAQVAYQRAYSTALAFGMTEAGIEELLRVQKPSQAKGEFDLFSPRKGTVFNIHFTEGEYVEQGRVLLQIIDEDTVWVDAKLQPELASSIKVGSKVQIVTNNKTVEGRVIQVHHQLDEITRTRSVRVEVPNSDDTLHPGQFINCQIEAGRTEPLLSVPLEAVVRTAVGDNAIYIERKPNEFQSVEVKIIKTVGKEAILEGIEKGTRVVVEGAFFLHSELGKKGFDAHGH